jgi:hypothetical protein
MGKVRVVYFHVQSSKGGSPRLCQLRIDRLALVNKIDYVLTHTEIWDHANLVASRVSKLDDTLPRFTDVQWESYLGHPWLPVEVIAWKTALG